MNNIETIRSFSREWVNGTGRTPDRKKLIIDTYQQLFNEKLRSRCSTCLIEAIFKIINYKPMENKSHFRLKKGAILQPFGGGIITNDNLTDEIAFECLRTRVANPSMFAVMPEIQADENKPDLDIVPTGDADDDKGKTTVTQIAGANVGDDIANAGSNETTIVHETTIPAPDPIPAPVETKPDALKTNKSGRKSNRPKTYKPRKK